MSYKGMQPEFGSYQLKIDVLPLFALLISPPEVALDLRQTHYAATGAVRRLILASRLRCW